MKTLRGFAVVRSLQARRNRRRPHRSRFTVTVLPHPGTWIEPALAERMARDILINRIVDTPTYIVVPFSHTQAPPS